MATAWLREQFREEPRQTVISVVSALGVYVAVGLVRPRWLTLASRRTWRGWLWYFAFRLLLVAGIEIWLKPFLQRSDRARSDLEAELGREPTAEEHMARLKRLRVKG